jgi:hypothetical protein
MRPKVLPLPVGAHAPLGSAVRFWQQHGFRDRVDSAALIAGVALAAAGAWLGAHPAALRVAVDGGGYHLGSITLASMGAERYDGEMAIVIRRADGQVRAGAAGKIHGLEMNGLCVVAPGASTERCVFVVGRRKLQAMDRLIGGTWERTYDDGTRVQIQLADPGHPVPVPVPVGEQ